MITNLKTDRVPESFGVDDLSSYTWVEDNHYSSPSDYGFSNTARFIGFSTREEAGRYVRENTNLCVIVEDSERVAKYCIEEDDEDQSFWDTEARQYWFAERDRELRESGIELAHFEDEEEENNEE